MSTAVLRGKAGTLEVTATPGEPPSPAVPLFLFLPFSIYKRRSKLLALSDAKLAVLKENCFVPALQRLGQRAVPQILVQQLGQVQAPGQKVAAPSYAHFCRGGQVSSAPHGGASPLPEFQHTALRLLLASVTQQRC